MTFVNNNFEDFGFLSGSPPFYWADSALSSQPIDIIFNFPVAKSFCGGLDRSFYAISPQPLTLTQGMGNMSRSMSRLKV